MKCAAFDCTKVFIRAGYNSFKNKICVREDFLGGREGKDGKDPVVDLYLTPGRYLGRRRSVIKPCLPPFRTVKSVPLSVSLFELFQTAQIPISESS